MTTPWWKHFPQSYWTSVDWAQWERDGRPRVPYDPRYKSPQRRPLDQVTPLASPPPVPSIGGLYAKPKLRHQSARSKSIDGLLESFGVGVR